MEAYLGEELSGALLDVDPVSSYPGRSDLTKLRRIARTTAKDAQSAMSKSALLLPPRRPSRAMPLTPSPRPHYLAKAAWIAMHRSRAFGRQRTVISPRGPHDMIGHARCDFRPR
jgi:hypothetical protein